MAILAASLVACAAESDPEISAPEGIQLIPSDEGNAVQAAFVDEDSTVSSATAIDTEGPKDDPIEINAGCTHIRFCSNPSGNQFPAGVVICDTNDKPCTRQQRFDECFSDADFVCGNWTAMYFDPPI